MRFAATICVALVGAALWWTHRDAPAPQPEAPAAAPAPLRYDWPAGRAFHYALELSVDASVRLAAVTKRPGIRFRGAQQIETKLDLAGELELRSYGVHGEVTWLGLRFAQLDRHDFSLAGEGLLDDPATLQARVLAHEAVLEITPRGEVLAVRAAPDAPPVFMSLVQLVVGEMHVRLGDPPGWSLDETTHLGDAPTHYEIADDGAHVALVKRRDPYVRLLAVPRPEDAREQALTYAARAVIERGGPLRALAVDETLRLTGADGEALLNARSRTRLTLLRSTAFDAPPPVATAVHAPGQPAFDAERARRQHARQRIQGLTPDQLLNTLSQYAAAGAVPDHNRFLWRATGLLREDPALCAALVDMFTRADMTSRGRALLLDLLVGAGSPAAQEALLAALATEQATADAQYPQLFARVSLVKAPTAQTIAALEAHHAQPGPEGPQAAAYALGAGAGHLHRAGDAARARAIGERLAAELDEAEAPETLVTLLGAVGNAGLPGQAGAVARFSDHPRARVRYAAATALRRYEDATSRAALIEMATDPVEPVSRRAMRSLMRGELSTADVRRLQSLVARRAIDPKVYPEVVSALTPYLRRGPEAAATLRTMLEQRFENPRLKGRIRTLLGGA